MPNKTKSRVSKTSTKKSGFKFRWWMGLVLVVVVAVIGLVVLRFSKAAGGTVALWGGADCTRVTLNHVYAKATIPSNVCLINTGSGSVTYNHTVVTGKPTTYCVWGRYYIKPGEKLTTSLTVYYRGSDASRGSQNTYYQSGSGVSGYGTKFSVPGDNIKLACVNTSLTSVDFFHLGAGVVKSDGSFGEALLFLDQITAEY